MDRRLILDTCVFLESSCKWFPLAEDAKKAILYASEQEKLATNEVFTELRLKRDKVSDLRYSVVAFGNQDDVVKTHDFFRECAENRIRQDSFVTSLVEALCKNEKQMKISDIITWLGDISACLTGLVTTLSYKFIGQELSLCRGLKSITGEDCDAKILSSAIYFASKNKLDTSWLFISNDHNHIISNKSAILLFIKNEFKFKSVRDVVQFFDIFPLRDFKLPAKT